MATATSSPSEWTVDAVVTSRGQRLKCRHLVCSPSASAAMSQALATQTLGPMQPAETCGESDRVPRRWMCRALAILDRPLQVQGQSASSIGLSLVIPPHSPALGGVNENAVRGLQLGSALSVCPNDRVLLYLTTPAVVTDAADQPPDAHSALRDALEALVSTADLMPVGPAASAAAFRTDASDGPQEDGPPDGPGISRKSGSVEAETHMGEAHPRPKAVEVFYYSQSLDVLGPPPLPLPANIVSCVSPRPEAGGIGSALGLIGYQHAVFVAETTFRRHFPDLKWLSDLEEADDPSSSTKPNNDEEDAIDDLEAALGNLDEFAGSRSS